MRDSIIRRCLLPVTTVAVVSASGLYLSQTIGVHDAYGAFVEAKGPYDHTVAERLRKYIFSVGNTIDPAKAYRSFRGRDPKIEALMVKRGFSVKDTKDSKSAPSGSRGERR